MTAAHKRWSRVLLLLCCAAPSRGTTPTHHAVACHRATRFGEERPTSRRASPRTHLVADRSTRSTATKSVDRTPPRLFGVRTLVISALLVRYRLTAFVSEVGESIRPLQVNPLLGLGLRMHLHCVHTVCTLHHGMLLTCTLRRAC